MTENIFRRLMLSFKSAFKKAPQKSPESNPPSPDAEGGIFRLWGWALPILFGLTVGWFAVTCLEVWLERLNGRNRPLARVSGLATSTQETDADNMTAFLRTNPFNVTPMAVPEFTEHEDDAPPKIVGSLATAELKGTSPGYIAWLEDQGKLRLVMLGDSFDVYTLEEVTYMDATFVKDEDRVVKELVYKPVVSLPARPQPIVSTANPANPANAWDVTPPNPGSGAPGVINRNTVNQLLENPFDELRKIRIRPADGEQGLQVEWINNDSILSQLGVKEKDVVHAINGIVFRNAMDISNSLNSLMASDQFVVEVIRNGVPTSLQYEVR